MKVLAPNTYWFSSEYTRGRTRDRGRNKNPIKTTTNHEAHATARITQPLSMIGVFWKTSAVVNVRNSITILREVSFKILPRGRTMDHQTKIVKISVLMWEYYLLHQLFVYFDENSVVVKVSDRSTILCEAIFKWAFRSWDKLYQSWCFGFL